MRRGERAGTASASGSCQMGSAVNLHFSSPDIARLPRGRPGPLKGWAQETLAHLAGIERTHMGKIKRGEHMPTLALIIRVARVLGCSAMVLIAETERTPGAPKDGRG